MPTFGEFDLELSIDLYDIRAGMKKIDRLEKNINEAVYRGLQKAADQIVKKLEANMDKYGVGGLKSGIFVEYSPTNFSIRVFKQDPENGENYALYVEYGTGIVGQGSPHPVPWAYDINDHGEKGWTYFKEGSWHHTRGMPARPYMYDTIRWVRSYSPIKRALNKELKRLIT